MSLDQHEDAPPKNLFSIRVPDRWFLLPGAAVIAGTTIGLVRGSRKASLRFLAENAHRPPTTVQGWYFYNKTKNYRVMLGGLKEAGTEASKLAIVAVGWVGIEEACKQAGLEGVGDVAAGLGTAGIFSAMYRLPWQASGRAMALGLIVGSALSGLRWGREYLQEEAQKQRARMEEGARKEEEAE